MFRLPFVIFSLILVPLLRYCEWRESIGLWTACPTYADVLYSDLLTLQFGCRPSPSLFNVHFIHQMAARCGRSYHPGRNNSSMMTALLLLMAGVERNPGPRASTNCFNSRSIVNQQRSAIRLGSLNAGGATTKAAIIDDLIRDNRLDILAVCESWILDDAPDAIKYDVAPDNYSVLHVHRQRSSKKKTAKARWGSGVHLQQSAFCQANQEQPRSQDVRVATGRRPSRQHCCQSRKHLPTTRAV